MIVVDCMINNTVINNVVMITTSYEADTFFIFLKKCITEIKNGKTYSYLRPLIEQNKSICINKQKNEEEGLKHLFKEITTCIIDTLNNDSVVLINNEYKCKSSCVDNIIIIDNEVELTNYFKHNNKNYSHCLVHQSKHGNIPFVVSKNINIFFAKDVHTFLPHDEIQHIYSLKDNEIIRYEYWKQDTNEHNMYCDEGIQGMEESSVYKHIDKPFELKYSHIKAIKEFIRKAEKGEL